MSLWSKIKSNIAARHRADFAKALGVPLATAPDGRHRLTHAMVAENPGVRWNAFVDVVANGPDNFTDKPRRDAALIFLYESEVQNGGHAQYFDNTDAAYAADTIVALRELGHGYSELLATAYQAHKDNPNGDDAPFDLEFYAKIPRLIDLLELQFEINESLYIEWVQ